MAMPGVTWCLTLLLQASLYDVTAVVISGADLGIQIDKVTREGIGSEDIQKLYDTEAVYKIHIPNGNKTIEKVVETLSSYIKTLYDVVQSNHDAIISSLSPSNATLLPAVLCCQVDRSTLIYVPHLGISANRNDLCVRFSTKSPDNPTTMRPNLLTSMRTNAEKQLNIGWQYYGDETGMHYTYMARRTCDTCCYGYDPRKRPWYNKARSPIPKDIVIVIDMTRDSDVSLKVKAAQTLLNATSPSDRLAVVAFCQTAFYPVGGTSGNACFSSSLALATSPNILSFLKFLSEAPACGKAAIYKLAISRAFEYLRFSPSNGPERKRVIVLLTDSDPSDAQPAAQIRKAAEEQNKLLNDAVIIMSYSFGSNISKSTESLLKNLANDTAYYTASGIAHHGTYTNIRSGENLRYQMRAFFSLFTDINNSSTPIITAPYVDFSGLGLVVSICKSVFHEGSLLGVTCVDARVEDIFLNVTYYQQGLSAYLFIINSEGRTISHPLLPKPSDISHKPVFVDISNLEREAEAQSVIESMKRGVSGQKSFYASRHFNQGISYGYLQNRQIVTRYYWRKVPKTDFSVCLVFTDEDGELKMKVNEKKDINYAHPLSLPDDYCANQGRKATTDFSTVQFNGSAYTSLPFSLTENDIKRRNTNYFTRSAKDQGRHFKANMIPEVDLTGRVDLIWRRLPCSLYSSFIKWRYLATTSGIIRVFPGTYFYSFNPNLQPWFQNAISNRGENVLTRINRDKKHCIMLSKAIVQGNPSRHHSSLDLPVAVVAGEFTNTYFYNMLVHTLDPCREKDAVCFLVDDKGYVLAHKAYTEDNSPHCHLITMEPAIAAHLQKQKVFEKNTCLDWEKYQVIHSWMLMPRDWIVRGSSPRYELHRVPNTNVFIGITWANKDRVAPSCGCTVLTDCSVNSDCPCYETLKIDYCKNTLQDQKRDTEESPTCVIVEDEFLPFEGFLVEKPTEQCFTHSCAEITTQSECLPRSRCAWCGDETKTCKDVSVCKAEFGPPPVPLHQRQEFLKAILIGVCVLSLLLLLLMAVCLCRCHLRQGRVTDFPPRPPPRTQHEEHQVSKGASGEPIYLGLNEAERVSYSSGKPRESASGPSAPSSKDGESSLGEQSTQTEDEPRTKQAPLNDPKGITGQKPFRPPPVMVNQRKEVSKPPPIPTAADVAPEAPPIYVNVTNPVTPGSFDHLDLEFPEMGSESSERTRKKVPYGDPGQSVEEGRSAKDSGFTSRNNDPSRYVVFKRL